MSSPPISAPFVGRTREPARLGGEVATRLRKRRGVDRDAGPGTPGHLGQAQLMEQYTNVVRAVAETHPLLLVVDDLHWADEASISLLFHLVRRVGDRRVLILGAFRANEIAAGRGDSRHPLEAPLNEIRRHQGDVEVDLPSGQADSGRQFIDQLLDAEANELDESFRDDLFRRTGGHALFTVELLHHLREGGLLARNANGRAARVYFLTVLLNPDLESAARRPPTAGARRAGLRQRSHGRCSPTGRCRRWRPGWPGCAP
jgi:hypothetical protein